MSTINPNYNKELSNAQTLKADTKLVKIERDSKGLPQTLHFANGWKILWDKLIRDNRNVLVLGNVYRIRDFSISARHHKYVQVIWYSLTEMDQEKMVPCFTL